MGLKKHVKARQARNEKLGALDAKNRCGYCRMALPPKVFLRWGDPAMYCSVECLAATEDDKS